MHSTAQKQQRVLFLLPALDAGGAERVLITLMNGLDLKQYKPMLLSVRGQGALQHLIKPSTPFYGLNQSLNIFSFPALLQQIKILQPDIIVSTMTHMNLAALTLKPFFPKTRFIVREAITPSFFLQKYPRWSLLLKWAYKILYPMADLVLSPSQKIFEEFEHIINLQLKKTYVLKNPVDSKSIHKKTTLWPIDKQQEETINFVACGRLGKQKGFDQLIEKLEQLHMPCDWHLNILGEGQERENLEQMIKEKGLENKISLKGLIIPPYPYFAAADCFLLPSRFEGLPNVVLESLACGTPVIATIQSGGITEIADDCGLENVRIAKNMDEFINEMQKIKAKPKKKALQSLLAKAYSPEVVFKEFDNLLQQINA